LKFARKKKTPLYRGGWGKVGEKKKKKKRKKKNKKKKKKKKGE
jgi:hypothetical protein